MSGLKTPVLLGGLYALTVCMHLWLLYGVWVAPYIAHDEVQYCLSGENIRAGRGMMMRGGFASTVPPLYPLFVAVGHSVPWNPRLALFIMSVLAVCALLFPAYWIARDIGLTLPLSAVAALSASFLPQTF